MSKQSDAALRTQLHRLIIENRDETGAIDASDQSAMADEILALITQSNNELLQEILEQKVTLSESAYSDLNGNTAVSKREAVPVQVIQKLIDKGDA